MSLFDIIMIYRHSNNKTREQSSIEKLKKDLKEEVQYIIKTYDRLDFQITRQYYIFYHQIKLIRKIEKIKLNEIKKIEEKIDNDVYVDYQTIECILKKVEIIQNLKNDMILNYEKVEQFMKEIDEEIRNVKQCPIDSCNSEKELNKISNYLNQFLKKLEDYDIHNKYLKEFISIYDISDENIESLNLKVTIGEFDCNEENFQQALILLKKFIDLTEIKEINYLRFFDCSFSRYSDETKQMFKLAFSSLDIIEKIELDCTYLSDEDVLLFLDCKFNNSVEDKDIWQKKLII